MLNMLSKRKQKESQEEEQLTMWLCSWHELAVKSAHLSLCIKSMHFTLKDGRGKGFCQENTDICSNPMAQIPRSSHQMWAEWWNEEHRGKMSNMNAVHSEQRGKWVIFHPVVQERKDNFRKYKFCRGIFAFRWSERNTLGRNLSVSLKNAVYSHTVLRPLELFSLLGKSFRQAIFHINLLQNEITSEEERKILPRAHSLSF